MASNTNTGTSTTSSTASFTSSTIFDIPSNGTTTNPNNSDDGGPGGIIGAVIGGLLLVTLIVGGFFYMRRRRQRQQRARTIQAHNFHQTMAAQTAADAAARSETPTSNFSVPYDPKQRPEPIHVVDYQGKKDNLPPYQATYE